LKFEAYPLIFLATQHHNFAGEAKFAEESVPVIKRRKKVLISHKINQMYGDYFSWSNLINRFFMVVQKFTSLLGLCVLK